MRKLLNTLYVAVPDSYLSRDGENLVVKMEERDPFRLPIHNLESIVTHGRAGASPALMQLCAERGVALSFLDENGRFLASVHGRTSGNVLLRRKQYRMADNQDAVQLARRMVFAKIANSRTVLKRGLRDHAQAIDAGKVEKEADFLKRYLTRVLKVETLDDLRGVEGEAARRYFSALDELILGDKSQFFLRGRNRRPPLDRMNALLSYLYTLLRVDMESALATVGLDPAVGFLHRDRPGRQSLALDLMEELRPCLVDRLVLSLVNRKQVQASQFLIEENGAVLLKSDLKTQVISAWQERKREEVQHPYLAEKIPIGLLPYAQALLLARTIRGDLAEYPPFLWR